MDKFSYAHDAYYGSLVGETSCNMTPAKPAGHDFVAEWLVASIAGDATPSTTHLSKSKRVMSDIWHS